VTCSLTDPTLGGWNVVDRLGGRGKREKKAGERERNREEKRKPK